MGRRKSREAVDQRAVDQKTAADIVRAQRYMAMSLNQAFEAQGSVYW